MQAAPLSTPESQWGADQLTPRLPNPSPHHRPRAAVFICRRAPPSARAVTDPLRLSSESELHGGRLVRLPVAVRRVPGGRPDRYVWDGARLRLVSLDGDPADPRSWPHDGLLEQFRSTLRHLFVPRQVPDNYTGYLKWKLLHRIFSSALQFLATQAMFRAIGIGCSRSLPSAAALNWVLKDGLGRLSRCIYTAVLGSAFDTNLKRVRFSTCVLFSLSIGIELLTPAFPQYFLLLATIANIGKSISLAAYLATGSAIHRSFAIADNLGEVSAKSQFQTVCFDNLGLLLAASLNILFKNNHRFQAELPLIIYPIFSAVDLFAIYQGLKFVHLQTLTKDRLEIIIDSWILLGIVLSPAEVSKREGVYFSRKGSKLWPIRIGCIDPKNSSSVASALTLQSLTGEDFYFICMEMSYKGLRRKQQGILLCLREMAGTSDIITGLLQACHIRKTLLRKNSFDTILEDADATGSMLKEWFRVVEESKMCTRKDHNHLKNEIQRAGWAVKNILLNPKEQIRYTMVNDK